MRKVSVKNREIPDFFSFVLKKSGGGGRKPYQLGLSQPLRL